MLSVNIPTHCHNPNFDNQGQSGIPFWPPKKKKTYCHFYRRQILVQQKWTNWNFAWVYVGKQKSYICTSNGKILGFKRAQLYFNCFACKQARLSQGLKYQGLILFHWFLACDAILETYVQLIFSSFEGSDEKSRSGHWQLIWHQENMGHGQTAFQIFSFSTF